MSGVDVAAQNARLRSERDDARGGYRAAAEYLDCFRDVLADCLGYPDSNPGDDVLLRELREHFGRTGPEPTRWRDFCSGALAIVDQINADRRGASDSELEMERADNPYEGSRARSEAPRSDVAPQGDYRDDHDDAEPREDRRP